jgi:hypothetical protein
MLNDNEKNKEGQENPKPPGCPFKLRCLEEGSDHTKFLKKSSWQSKPECLREDARTCGRSFCYGSLYFCKCPQMQEKLKPEF